MKNINNDVVRNYELENEFMIINNELKTLIETRRIFKRNKLDYSDIQKLINQKNLVKVKYLSDLLKYDHLYNDKAALIILNKYLDRRLCKDDQKELLNELRILFGRIHPNLILNNKKGLSSWINHISLSRLYTMTDYFILEFDIKYIKNDDNNWCDMIIRIKNTAYDTEEEIELIDNKIYSKNHIHHIG